MTVCRLHSLQSFVAWWLLSVCLLLSACTPSSAPSSPSPLPPPLAQETGLIRWHYQVSLQEDFRQLDATLCLEGQAPKNMEWVIGSGTGTGAGPLSEASALTLRDSQGLEIQALPTLQADACLYYSIDLHALSSIGAWPHASGTELLIDPRDWLLRPKQLRKHASATLTLAPLPEGHQLLTPWPLLEEHSSHNIYALDITSFVWKGVSLFLRSDALHVQSQGTQLTIGIFAGDRVSTNPGVKRWLKLAIDTVASLYGHYPQEHMLVAILPTPNPLPDAPPVIFGSAWRGGGSATILYLNTFAKDASLAGEWVAIHEFFHHSMPVITRHDSWFSEGFTTYYTTVLRARQGLLCSPEGELDGQAQVSRALQELYDGFQRADSSPTSLSLREASDHLLKNHHFSQVYWGGAAIALQADLSIRKESGDHHSLDEVMRALEQCCLNTPRLWLADDVLLTNTRDRSHPQANMHTLVRHTASPFLDSQKLPLHVLKMRDFALSVQEQIVHLENQPNSGVLLRESIFAPPSRAILH